MFTSFKFLLCGFVSCLWLAVTVNALAQVAPSAANAPVLLPLNAKQQASLGVQVAAVQASTGGQLLASATVVALPSYREGMPKALLDTKAALEARLAA